jgi:hypothetical protein
MRAQTKNLKVLALAYLEANCQGRQNGISKAELARALSVPMAQERRLREALDLLADEHPIGSSPEHGYFYCRDARDLAEAKRTIAGYAFPTLRRLRALERHERAWRGRQLPPVEQGSLFAPEGAR